MNRASLWPLLLLALPLFALEPRVIRIPMRDGQMLAADLYVPDGGVRHAVILVQTPYNKDLMRPAFAGKGRLGAHSLFTDPAYAFVVADVRGRSASKSAQVAGKAINQGEDGYDVIAWIVKQTFSNGQVATWGASALGKVQYETAKERPPALVCSVPLVMLLALDYDAYFPGGVLWNEFANMLGKLGWSVYDSLTKRPVKDDYWTQVHPATYVTGSDIQVPMLFTGGWFDIYTDGVIDSFEAVRKQGGPNAKAGSKLIMGPWLHLTDREHNGSLDFPGAEGYGMKRAQAFIADWFKGGGAASKDPSITYYQMGANEWRTSEVWPPQGVMERPFYLQGDHGLSTSAPASAAPGTFRFDPSSPAPTIGGHLLDPSLGAGPQDQREKVESRSDVLAFSTPVLTEEVAVAGKVRVKLHVSSDRPDTDFTAILTDVYPDGRSILITEGIHRMRFRNSTSKEEFLKPGEVYPVTIDLTNTAITFKKGHRIRVLVSSSNYPKYAVNLNDGEAMYSKAKGAIATNTVYHDAGRPSVLLLPAW